MTLEKQIREWKRLKNICYSIRKAKEGELMAKRLIKTRMKSMEPFKPDAVIKKHEREMDEINQTIIKSIQRESSAPVQLSWLPTKSARSSFFAPITAKRRQR